MNISAYNRVWVTSDTHFGHTNIIKYCDRPFTNTEDMDQAIIKDWNSKVGPEDLVIHLGDVTFKSKSKMDFIMSQLSGKKMLILGNHDRRQDLEEHFLEGCFHYLSITRGSQHYILMHYPIESWDRKFHDVPHLHGHCHGTVNNAGLLRFDMGWDVWEGLVDLDWLTEYIKKNKTKLLDKTPPVPFRDTFFKKLYERASKDEESLSSP